MLKDKDIETDDCIGYEERSKLLWSLRSDFAWAGKKIPEVVEIDEQNYRLRDLIRKLEEEELPDPTETAEIRALIPKLREKAAVNEEILETKELTKTEAQNLYEETTGLLRAVMELNDRLERKSDEKSVDEFKRMLNTQKVVDEKRWQELIKSLK